MWDWFIRMSFDDYDREWEAQERERRAREELLRLKRQRAARPPRRQVARLRRRPL
jgi:hypothetical protein